MDYSIDLEGEAVRSGGHSREVGQLRHDDSLATTLLVSRLCADGMQPSLEAAEFWRLIDHIGDPGQILGKRVEGLTSGGGLSEDLAHRISALTDRATAMAFELDRLERSGIRTLTVFDEYYPQKWLDYLRQKAPPVVHAAGAVELLDVPGLGVVGSRDVTAAGGEVAREIGRFAARRGFPLVSGGARGVDQLAMDAALDSGGAVVGILAESLSRKLKRPDVRRAVYDGATVLCTPYSPDAPFSAGNAMGRNKLIYGQAVLTVVVACDDGSGGTWSGAAEALKNGYGLVAVWRGTGEGPGNESLERRDAIPVASMADIVSVLDDELGPGLESLADPAAPSEQQSLFASNEDRLADRRRRDLARSPNPSPTRSTGAGPS